MRIGDYVSTETPTSELKRVVFFILNHYGPGWFRYRVHPKISDGAKNLFFLIRLSKNLPDEDREIVQDVLGPGAQRILDTLRKRPGRHAGRRAEGEEGDGGGPDQTGRTRRQDEDPEEIRQFTVPDINFDAKECQEMIAWDSVTEPPLTMDMPDDEITAAVDDPMDFSDFPCHSQ